MKRIVLIVIALFTMIMFIGCSEVPSDESWEDVQVEIIKIHDIDKGVFTTIDIVFKLPDGNKLSLSDMTGPITYREYLEEGDSITLQYSNYDRWRYKDFRDSGI